MKCQCKRVKFAHQTIRMGKQCFWYSLRIMFKNLTMRHSRKWLCWKTTLFSGKGSRRNFQGTKVLSVTLTKALENGEIGKAYLGRIYFPFFPPMFKILFFYKKIAYIWGVEHDDWMYMYIVLWFPTVKLINI